MKIKVALLVLVGSALAIAAGDQHCGIERWPVKTLQDPGARMIHFTPVESTVYALRVPQPPPDLRKINPTLRLDGEKQVYSVQALLLGFKREADGDYHLVLGDLSRPELTMIAEIPAPSCANKQYAAQFTAAAAFVEGIHHGTPTYFKLPQSAPVSVTGVFFFDFIHGQTGVAPNGAELHPVLAISKL